MPACDDDEVLALIRARTICHRCGLTTGGQTISPKLPARLHVECAQIVVLGRRDEDEIPRGRDWTAPAWRAEGRRGGKPWTAAFGRTEGHLPGNAVSAQVDADERTPGRSRAGQT